MQRHEAIYHLKLDLFGNNEDIITVYDNPDESHMLDLNYIESKINSSYHVLNILKNAFPILQKMKSIGMEIIFETTINNKIAITHDIDTITITSKMKNLQDMKTFIEQIETSIATLENRHAWLSEEVTI